MDQYQEIYQDKIGSAKLDIKKAVAGSKINCRLTYRAGFYGIDDSGSLKILFRIVADFGEFQFADPEKENFVRVSSSNKNITIKVDSRSQGMYGSAYIRPWSRGVTLHFSQSALQPGDEIYLDFHN